MNKLLTLLLLTIFCLSPTLAQFRGNKLENNFKNLNESIKAVFAAVLDTMDSIKDSSDDSSDDKIEKSSDFSNLSTDKSQESSDGSCINADDVLAEIFGEDNRFLDGLVEMVAVSLEDIFDHANKFILSDEERNVTAEVSDASIGDALVQFKDFQAAITGLIDNVLDESIRIDDEEYIVRDKDVNKLNFEVEKEEEKEKEKEKEPEISQSEVENEGRVRKGLKNGLKTISFIKSKLARKAKDLGYEESYVKRAADKVLRRQNAMRQSDFERYLDEDRGEMSLNKINE